MPIAHTRDTCKMSCCCSLLCFYLLYVKGDQALGCLLTMCNSAWPEGVDDSGNCATALHKAWHCQTWQ